MTKQPSFTQKLVHIKKCFQSRKRFPSLVTFLLYFQQCTWYTRGRICLILSDILPKSEWESKQILINFFLNVNAWMEESRNFNFKWLIIFRVPCLSWHFLNLDFVFFVEATCDLRLSENWQNSTLVRKDFIHCYSDKSLNNL